MGIFDFFNADQWKKDISEYVKEITDSNPFRYFMDRLEEHKVETLLVKKYYAFILAAAIHHIRSKNGLIINMRSITTKELHDHFYSLTTYLRETYIINGKIKLSYFGNQNYIEKSLSMLNYFCLTQNFMEEVEQSLISDDPYFLEEWIESEHDYDEEFGNA